MKVLTFGELMLRLAPPNYNRFMQVPMFEATFGGGEANTAISLSHFGIQSAFVTKLPNNDIGKAAVSELRKHGVDTSSIVFGGERMGLYYLERGAAQRPSKVIYDRKFSAISQADVEDFDFNAIMKGASWFHFTGITPALGKDLPAICANACKAAKEQGALISFDLNYRSSLWSALEAGRVMAGLMEHVDVLIANEEHAKMLFGIEVKGGKSRKEAYIEIAEKLAEKFNISKVCITIREGALADDTNFSAMLYENGNGVFSKEYSIRIVDRIGAGDALAAGLIYSFLNNYESQRAIDFAVAAACLKHTIEGDYNLVSIEEVQALLAGNGASRVQR